MESKAISNNLSKISDLNDGNYVFQKLNASHAKEAIKLLGIQFQEQQPLSMAFYKSFEADKQKRVQNWVDFWVIHEDIFFESQLSVGCFDAHTGELVGVTVAKDINQVPQGFFQRFLENFNYMSCIIHLEEKIMGQTDGKYQQLFKQNGVIMDIWGVAIKKEHMGKKLLHKMMIGNNYLGVLKGFQYSFVYVTNFKTEIALNKLDYLKIGSQDASQFEENGVRCFEKIQQIQKYASLFIKKIKQN